jgi:hypothetical protein
MEYWSIGKVLYILSITPLLHHSSTPFPNTDPGIHLVPRNAGFGAKIGAFGEI